MSGPLVDELHLSEPNDISRYSGWAIDFRQIQIGRMQTRLFARNCNCITLLEIRMDRAVHQQGCSPGDAITLGLPLSPALYSWNGAEIETPGLLNFGSSSEFDGVSGANFAGLTVSVANNFLARVSDRIGLALPDDFLRLDVLPIRRNSRALRRLGVVGSAALHRAGFPFGEAEQEDFIAGLVSAAADSEKFDDRSDLALRTRSVRLAVNYIREHADENTRISELCTISGVSWRTLDRGFREQFGIGPKTYLNQLRLGRVRSDLLQIRSDARIADIANRWGFWHMGQFARDYKRMFGELPSDTLRTAG